MPARQREQHGGTGDRRENSMVPADLLETLRTRCFSQKEAAGAHTVRSEVTARHQVVGTLWFPYRTQNGPENQD
jgi:hypothetical protein